jgi:Tol biopolymer transport system component
MNARLLTAAVAVALAAGLLRPDSLVTAQAPHAPPAAPSPEALARLETHLTDIRMLTDEGENAEAYFSPDGTRLIFQSSPDPVSCDQMYVMKIDGSDLTRVSNGQGRTTCGFFTRDSTQIVYASTHGQSPACPPRPSMARGYVWPIYDGYDIYKADADGRNAAPLTRTPGYDAEATVGANGRIVFTSVRDGDMEIYSMALDGSDVKRLTNLPGPDGGAFYSPDGSQIVFRGRHPQAGSPEFTEYFALLGDGLWRPTSTELYVMNADGSGLRQVTDNGAANFAPYWTPDGRRLIFSSNLHNVKGRDFELFLVDADGRNLERITHHPDFDGFPMFSPDGTQLAFASNRQQKTRGDTNIFIARWKP